METDYFHTWQGKFEYYLMQVMYGAMLRNQHKFPFFWYGALNSMALYLDHCAYSPFFDNQYTLGRPKEKLTWDMRHVPFGQEDLVDENFLPRLRIEIEKFPRKFVDAKGNIKYLNADGSISLKKNA